MKYKNIHFIFEKRKSEAATFAQTLMDDLGQSSLEDADLIISVGGDGLLLQALRMAEGRPVYGIRPPHSNSRGFWTDHDVDSVQKLKEKLEAADVAELLPLRAEISYANGNTIVRHAFNDFAIERASGQSVLFNLTAEFSKACVKPYRIMGDGFVFSTALGSTGTNRSYGGPIADIHNSVIILTGKGIYEPRAMAPMVAKGDTSVFHINFLSAAHKRPVRIDYDGLSISNDNDGSPIDMMKVSIDKSKAGKILVTDEPGIRAFTAMMP